MNTDWNDLIRKMPVLLEELKSQPLRPCTDRSGLPKKGVYIFYEDGKPIYVGRSNSVRRRIGLHYRPSSGHNSATFAFNIAKREAIKGNQHKYNP